MIAVFFPSFGSANIISAIKNINTDLATYIIATLIFAFILIFEKIKKKKPSPVTLIIFSAAMGIIVCPIINLIK